LKERDQCALSANDRVAGPRRAELLMPLPAGSFVGYSGPQALDPLFLGII